ncbi:hypothetical protein GO491_03475 [Flavobacteriaceae bacterium Ap0902]|nr:hypothetical protein [Flavobacteriaceae bacterium Ap0902]
MQKNWKILLFSLSLTLGLFSCKKNPPQYPTTYSNDDFMEYSQKFNRELKDLELEKINDYTRNHPEDYLYTNAGFYMTRTRMDSAYRVQDFDTIQFDYELSNLQDDVIYSFDEIGNQTMVLGQSPMIQGLEYGLKRMSEGENAIILIPSSLGYGVSGDGDKIGTDQPLKIELRLNEILNHEN